MNRTLRALLTVTALAGLLAVAAPADAASGEFTVSGSWLTGATRDDRTYSSENVAFRFAIGNRIRFRAYVPYVRLDRPDSVIWSVVGPVPIPPGQGPGDPGGGNGDPTGPGPGSGSSSGSGSSGSGNQGTDPGGGSGSSGDTGSGPGNDPSGAILDPAASLGTTDATTLVPTTVDGGAVSGLGDARVGLTARLLGSGADLGRLSAELDVKAPTADVDDGLGTGEWDARLGLSAERRGWYGAWFGGGGWTRFGDPDWIDLRDGADGWVGFETEPWRARLAWSVWIETARSAVADYDDPLYLGLGVRRETRRPWHVYAWVGLDGDSPDFAFTVGWSPGSISTHVGRRGDLR